MMQKEKMKEGRIRGNKEREEMSGMKKVKEKRKEDQGNIRSKDIKGVKRASRNGTKSCF